MHQNDRTVLVGRPSERRCCLVLGCHLFKYDLNRNRSFLIASPILADGPATRGQQGKTDPSKQDTYRCDSHGNSTSERDSAVANEWVDLPARLKEQKGMRNLPATAARCSVWWSLPFWPARQVIKAVLCEVPAAHAQHL